MQGKSKRKGTEKSRKKKKGKQVVSIPACLCCPEKFIPPSQQHEKVLVVNPTIKPGFKSAADVVMRRGICMFLMHSALFLRPDGNGINNNLWGKQAHRRDQM